MLCLFSASSTSNFSKWTPLSLPAHLRDLAKERYFQRWFATKESQTSLVVSLPNSKQAQPYVDFKNWWNQASLGHHGQDPYFLIMKQTHFFTDVQYDDKESCWTFYPNIISQIRYFCVSWNAEFQRMGANPISFFLDKDPDSLLPHPVCLILSANMKYSSVDLLELESKSVGTGNRHLKEWDWNVSILDHWRWNGWNIAVKRQGSPPPHGFLNIVNLNWHQASIKHDSEVRVGDEFCWFLCRRGMGESRARCPLICNLFSFFQKIYIYFSCITRWGTNDFSEIITETNSLLKIFFFLKMLKLNFHRVVFKYFFQAVI